MEKLAVGRPVPEEAEHDLPVLSILRGKRRSDREGKAGPQASADPQDALGKIGDVKPAFPWLYPVTFPHISAASRSGSSPFINQWPKPVVDENEIVLRKIEAGPTGIASCPCPL